MFSKASVVGLLVCILFAGCLDGDDPSGGNQEEVSEGDCDLTFDAPIMLGDAGPGALASEPSIAFGPDGTVAVASIWIPAHLLPLLLAGQGTGVATHLTPLPSVEPGGQNAVWVAPGGGDFISRHDALGRLSLEGHQGNQDADIAITPDGRIHVALFGPSGIEVMSSQDQGESWSPSGLVSPQYVDRQWIAAGPEGRLVVTWNEFGTIANVGGSGDGIGLAYSEDSGSTWSDAGHIHPTAFSAGPIQASIHGFVAVARDDGQLWLISSPDGQSWNQSSQPTQLTEAGGFVVAAPNPDGSVHLIWTASDPDGTAAINMMTHEQGLWTEAVRTSPAGHNAVFPWPVLRPDGSLVIFSYQSEQGGDPTQGERVWSLSFDMLCSGAEEWSHGTVMAAAHHGAMCLNGAGCPLVNYDSEENDRSVGEVFEAGTDAAGRIWVTWTGTTAGPARSNQIWVAPEAPI